jgi:hypothetical protein
MKTSIHLKIAPMLWEWVTKKAKKAGSKIAVVEQAITEMKARDDAKRPAQAGPKSSGAKPIIQGEP